MPKGFVNMQLPKKVKKEMDAPCVHEVAEGRPRYPYGLEVRLETESLKKLGYSAEDFGVGGKVQISAMCNVETVRSSDRMGGEPSESVTLQITDLSIVKISNKKMTRKDAIKNASKSEY